ncbi:hypothetical protein SLT36_02970 [Aminobacter sp. BA135]|uniref:hypothetical protein n=1 Tax=Aminobacter sp. BA135 TaxID=537596 RepID=UPI003D79299F
MLIGWIARDAGIATGDSVEQLLPASNVDDDDEFKITKIRGEDAVARGNVDLTTEHGRQRQKSAYPPQDAADFDVRCTIFGVAP